MTSSRSRTPPVVTLIIVILATSPLLHAQVTQLPSGSAAMRWLPTTPIGSLPHSWERDGTLIVCYLHQPECKRCVRCEDTRSSVSLREWCQRLWDLPFSPAFPPPPIARFGGICEGVRP